MRASDDARADRRAGQHRPLSRLRRLGHAAPPKRQRDEPAGYTGKLQAGSLVYLRARWYHTALGTFTSRDTYPGTPERSQSLHRSLYTEGNPVNYQDPSGQCIEWIDRNCKSISWEDFWAGRWNWADGKTYWLGVGETAYGMTLGSFQLLYDAATNPTTQAQMGRGMQALQRDFGGSAAIVGDAMLTPVKDIYGGIVCGDSNRLGRGLTAYFFVLLGARKGPKQAAGRDRLAGPHGRAWWEHHKATVLDEATLQQTNPYNCGATCIRIIGLPEKIAAEIERFARNNGGIELPEVSPILKKYGVPHTLSEIHISMIEAMPEMQQALLRNERVIARVEGHMVVVKSIEKVGAGARDYRIRIADPDTGHIVELTGEAWTNVTWGQNTFITVP